MENQPILELKGISKRFGKIVANNNINLDLKKGEILALLGENGSSGKSTCRCCGSGLCTWSFSKCIKMCEDDQGKIPGSSADCR